MIQLVIYPLKNEALNFLLLLILNKKKSLLQQKIKVGPTAKTSLFHQFQNILAMLLLRALLKAKLLSVPGKLHIRIFLGLAFL